MERRFGAAECMKMLAAIVEAQQAVSADACGFEPGSRGMAAAVAFFEASSVLGNLALALASHDRSLPDKVPMSGILCTMKDLKNGRELAARFLANQKNSMTPMTPVPDGVN